jgi:hypothetical protein
MKRINIRYGGTTYSVRDRDLAELQQEISTAVAAGQPYWLTVNEGEGTPRSALLLFTPGVDCALVPLPESQPELDPSGEAEPEPAR